MDSKARFAEFDVEEDLEPLLDQALQSQCPADGQNLLMYAAAQGNEAQFLRLVDRIRSRVRARETSQNNSMAVTESTLESWREDSLIYGNKVRSQCAFAID